MFEAIGLSSFFLCTLMQQAALGLCVYLPFRGGLLNLGVPAFFTLGGYCAALVSTRYLMVDAATYPMGFFMVSATMAFFVCFGLAAAMGSLILSLRGIYFGLITICLIELSRVFSLNSDTLGGAIGIFGIPPLFEQNEHQLLFWVGFLIFFVLILQILVRFTIWGKCLDPIREDELAARCMGMSVARSRLMSFCVSSGLAGLVGAASAHLLGTWNPRQSSFDLSVTLLSYVIMGGSTGSLPGSLAGAFILGSLPELLRPLNESRLLFNGIILTAVSVYFPGGFSHFFKRKSVTLKTQNPKDSAPYPSEDTPHLNPFKNQPRLEIQNISCQFGGIAALKQVSFTVYSGEIFGIIGPNGAGKSTLFNVISGVVSQTSGDLIYHTGGAQNNESGQPETYVWKPQSTPCHLRAQQGLARTFQNIRLFKNLSALDHLTKVTRNNSKTHQTDVKRLLDFFSFDFDLTRPAQELPYGDQRRLEIARALALNPALLLLDEPAAGMNPSEKMALVTLLGRIRSSFKCTILIVEHHIPTMMSLCDRIAVLHHGELIAVETPQGIQNHPQVREAYLGRTPP